MEGAGTVELDGTGVPYANGRFGAVAGADPMALPFCWMRQRGIPRSFRPSVLTIDVSIEQVRRLAKQCWLILSRRRARFRSNPRWLHAALFITVITNHLTTLSAHRTPQHCRARSLLFSVVW